MRSTLIFSYIISNNAELSVVCISFGVSPLNIPNKPYFYNISMNTFMRVYLLLSAFICCLVLNKVYGYVKIVAIILEIAPMTKIIKLDNLFPTLQNNYH